MQAEPAAPATTFAGLDLPEPLLRALGDVGYAAPSPIQEATIPEMMAGRDVVGQAQTGTGKTAAFALPILAGLDRRARRVQALVLTPTRELGIQVADALTRYAAHLPNVRILPIYGGQSYGPQLDALARGVQVVVGTPGRLLDHVRRGSLDLGALRWLVLDEADEMLKMGFIDDVEEILRETPEGRQTALFSATMPPAIRRLAQTYLHDPVALTIASATTTASTIRQRCWEISGLHRLDALTRILEVEPFDAMIVFTRLKRTTDELAEALQGRGFRAAAMSGDLSQAQRERTIEALRDGAIDILVATDVAARGLDVDRVSHVVNYDPPSGPEGYVHRIGRTGRAGRSGEAILFLAPRERFILREIERATRQRIEPLQLPTIREVNEVRVARFKDAVSAMVERGGPELDLFRRLVGELEEERGIPAIDAAAALARLYRGPEPLLLERPPRADRRRGEGGGSWEERDERDEPGPRARRRRFRHG
ncbi:MAG: DEAD/DEAH box helicase [Myxococcales bacterium]|nr:DEAD/DEAH box helicase [Myxococcales bacterium]